MNQLQAMNVFVTVAEEQGFAPAARRLGMSPPAVTRAIAALEDRLGVKLLNRTTRFVRATEAGLRYLEDTRRILVQIDAADEAAAGINAEPRGNIAITAPVLFGRLFVLPGIVDFLERYQDTTVSALFLDRVVNLLEEGLDVGVRIGELPDSSLRALAVGSVRVITCASPKYLKRQGVPSSPDELIEHSVIASSAGSNFIDWRFQKFKPGASQGVIPRLTVTNNDAAIEAARLGLGITRLLSYQVAPLVACGELQLVLEDFGPPPSPIHIVHREGRYASGKIRGFIDLMAERLRAEKSLNPK